VKNEIPYRGSKRDTIQALKTRYHAGPQNETPYRASKRDTIQGLKTRYHTGPQNEIPYRASTNTWDFCDSFVSFFADKIRFRWTDLISNNI